MAVAWTNDLATGVGEIDDQHKELFDRINNLLEACKRGEGKKEVEKTIDFLEDYVIEHFSEEERLMTTRDYPEYGRHKGQHLKFMEDLSGLKGDFAADGPGVHIVVNTNRIVVDWLVNHIRKEDKALGAFLRSRR